MQHEMDHQPLAVSAVWTNLLSSLGSAAGEHALLQQVTVLTQAVLALPRTEEEEGSLRGRGVGKACVRVASSDGSDADISD